MFVVDAPVSRVAAVLKRVEVLRQIVENEWVRLFVRDPDTGKFYRQSKGEYVPVDMSYMLRETNSNYRSLYDQKAHGKANASHAKTNKQFIPYTDHMKYAMGLVKREEMLAYVVGLGMLLSCGLSMWVFDRDGKQLQGGLVAVGGTILSLCNLGFSKRYLHGEFMYDRFVLLALVMLVGFNLVAVSAPTGDLKYSAIGWSLLSFSSVFLIGAWNDRPTARENATFIYMIYAVTDGAMLVAWAFSHSKQPIHTKVAGCCLLLASILKCSQFPVSNLFARCMEGASPSSALGYAALSAHAGLVLLSATMEYWFEPFIWGRVVLAAVGGLTVVNACLVSKIRADRKGGVGNAVASTVGVLYIIMAAGYPKTALALAFGHATYRMVQILRAHNIILEHHIIQEALGHHNVGPKEIPECLYHLCWRLNRFNTDLQLPHVLHKLRWNITKSWELSKPMQYVMASVLLAQAGVPLTPITYWREEKLEEDLVNATAYQIIGCIAVMVLIMFISTCLVWLVNTSVLDPSRFHHKKQVSKQAQAMKGLKQPLLGINKSGFVQDDDDVLLVGS
jgi:hypothetical protein